MAYRNEVQRSAEKELAALSSTLQARVIKAIDGLATDPRPNGFKKLPGSKNAYRVRVGEFSIVYEVYDGVLVVIVIRVALRHEVYWD